MHGAHSGTATASAPTSRASRSASTASVAGEHAIELLADALGRQLGDARGGGRHQLARDRVGLQAVDAAARDAAQDAQRIVAEGRLVDGAQQTRREIVAPAERIDPLAAAHVARHRVDGEVAALEIVAHGQLGIGLDAEIGVRVARVAGLARARSGSRAAAGRPRCPRAAPTSARSARPRDGPPRAARRPLRARGRARGAPRRRGRARGSRCPSARARAARRATSRPPRRPLGTAAPPCGAAVPPSSAYSTVTVFARLRGWSIGRSRRRAMR